MKNKVCPLSFISGSEKVKLCVQSDCMLWDVNDENASCLIRDFLGWHSIYYSKAIEFNEKEVKKEKELDKTVMKREPGFQYG